MNQENKFRSNKIDVSDLILPNEVKGGKMKMYAVFTHSGSYEDYRSVLRFVTKRKWVADNWVKRYNKLLLKLKDHQLDMSHNDNFSEDEKINRNMRWIELMYTHEAYIDEVEKR